MKGRKKYLLLPGIALAVFTIAVLLTLALAAPTGTNFGVDDATGVSGTYVLVPVNITNVQNGPIAGIGFDILYDNSVITAVGIQAGGLTPSWDFSDAYTNYPWGTAVALVFNGTEIINGSTGSVVMLNFSVVGAPDTTSRMNLTNIQLSNLNGNVGTAPARNGTFMVTAANITGTTREANCSLEPNVTITIYNKTTGSAVAETTSDETGNYSVAVPSIGNYSVNASKEGFKNETQNITITETETTYTLNFSRDYGLTPEDPEMPYALECVNHWLYADLQPEECRLSMAKALEVVNAWLY